jgi:hypothetical protein
MGRMIQCPPLMLALDQIMPDLLCSASNFMAAKKVGVLTGVLSRMGAK